jgi:superfamily I DNA/RNA helicase
VSTSETRIDPGEWAAAVADVFGPQLVVAGPGTGKTEFLVQRIVHLIEQGHARPGQIQFLTFSRRSAADARSRILAGLPRSVGSIGSSTFHSFARRLLETFQPDLRFELLTGPEQVALVSDLLSEERPSGWPAHLSGLLGSQTLAADLADFMLRCAERSLTPEDIERMAIDDWKAIPDFMTRYRAELAARGRLDYAQLLAEAVAAVEATQQAEKVADQFRFMLVDEYQDTSPAQARLLEVVSRAHRNITAAGDPYQSVYSFRGADLENIASFPDRFRDREGRPARRVVLTTSHRVPAQILEAALRVTHGGELPGEAGPVIPAPHRGSVET